MASPYPRLIRSITVERCDRFMSRYYYSDINLYSQLYKDRESSQDYIKLKVYSVPDLKRITFAEAVKGEYKKAERGDVFGPSWVRYQTLFLIQVNKNSYRVHCNFVFILSRHTGFIYPLKFLNIGRVKKCNLCGMLIMKE
jgi:hypothetical protein